MTDVFVPCLGDRVRGTGRSGKPGTSRPGSPAERLADGRPRPRPQRRPSPGRRAAGVDGPCAPGVHNNYITRTICRDNNTARPKTVNVRVSPTDPVHGCTHCVPSLYAVRAACACVRGTLSYAHGRATVVLFDVE